MDQKTLQKLLGEMDKKELIKLIWYMVQFNGSAEDVLLNYVRRNTKHETNDILINASLTRHWEIAYSIIENANDYGGCSEDDENEAVVELENLSDIVKKNEIPWALRKEILDEMLEQIARDSSGFTDILVDTAFDICKSEAEIEYLADFLSEYGNGYYKSLAATTFLKIGKNDKFLNTQKMNLRYGSDYLKLAAYYKQEGKESQAIQISLEGIDKCSGRLDEIYEFLFDIYLKNKCEADLWALYDLAQKKKTDLDVVAKRMYEYTKSKGDYENQMKMLLILIQCCDHDELKYWYDKCQLDLHSTDWEIHQQELLQSIRKRNLPIYLEICIDNGDFAEVLKHLQNAGSFSRGSLDQGHRFSKVLSKTYPDEILSLYRQEVRASIEAGKEGYYRNAVNVLKEIQSIMKKQKRIDEWDQELIVLKDRYKRKRLFISLLNEKFKT